MKKLIKVNDKNVMLSFEEVLEKYKKLIIKIANSKTVGIGIHRMEIEDIVSELELVCWKCYNDYNVDKGVCFSTLLYKYCNNRVLQLIRSVANKQEYLSESDEFGVEEVEGQADHYFEDGQALIDAVAKNDRERQIMILLSQDMDKKDIAKTLGIARSGLYKTLDKLKVRMAQHLSL